MPDTDCFVNMQVKKFKSILPDYENFALLLKSILKKAADRMQINTIVQVRAKKIPSFAEKIIRKKDKYTDPVNQLTDLCGGRVIVSNTRDIGRICEFIRMFFDIDEANSEDTANRLGKSRFGYRSIHFIVSLKPEKKDQLIQLAEGIPSFSDSEPSVERLLQRKSLGPDQNDPLFSGPQFKAEIQVRTMTEHAWSEFYHDQIYKSSFAMPPDLERAGSRIAANLEAVEEAFEKTTRAVAEYKSYFGAYMNGDQLNRELEKLQTIHDYDSENLDLALRISRIATYQEDWDIVIVTLEPFLSKWEQSPEGRQILQLGNQLESAAANNDQDTLEKVTDALKEYNDPMLAELLLTTGTAQWNKTRLAVYRKNMTYARLLDPLNISVPIALARTYMDQNIRRALSYYEKAFFIEPADPEVLMGLILSKSAIEGNLDYIPTLRPVLHNSISICRKRANVNTFLPEAFYCTGLFNMLLGNPYESLISYAKAVHFSSTVSQIEDALKKVEQLFYNVGHAQGLVAANIHLEWVIQFFKTAILSRSVDKAANLELSSGPAVDTFKNARVPLFMVVGGCHEKCLDTIRDHTPLFQYAFQGYAGVLVCGGTKDGISGLVGDLNLEYSQQPTKIAYLPKYIPSDVDKHPAYKIFCSQGTGFSPLEAILCWTDLFLAGKRPEDVTVLGVNGGNIALFEYHMSLAFGARLGVLAESGRAAHEILQDPEWCDFDRLLPLPHDRETLRIFVQGIAGSDLIDSQTKENIARQNHEIYRRNRIRQIYPDPALESWENLRDDLKASNIKQVECIADKLKTVGLTVRPVADKDKIEAYRFTDEQVEVMAQMEHGRWNIERLLEGWKPGERDHEKKKSPYLISWEELSEEIRHYDRVFIYDLPQMLKNYGYEITPMT